MIKKVSQLFDSIAKVHRSPRYVVLALVASVVYVLSALLVNSEKLPGPLETALFELINNQDPWMAYILYPLTHYGAAVLVPVLALLALLFRHKLRPAAYVLLAGASAWVMTSLAKAFSDRGRPEEFFDNVMRHSSESFLGLGFPSGHVTAVAAMTVAIWPFVSPLTRRLLVVFTGVVMFSRIYMGGHLPLDVVGGVALGAIVGSAIVLALGAPIREVNLKKVKRILKGRGIKLHSIKPASVDARGSVPYFAKTSEGVLFIKFFGKEQFSADWLFRIVRYLKYKNLKDEAPYLGLKRNLEHEALMSVLARHNGIRTPEVVGFFRVDNYYWGLAQKLIDGTGLDSMKPDDITDEILERIWIQIKLLHQKHVAHRDLRAANIFIDKENQPWVIDFGFAESMANTERMYMDTAEMLASLSTIIGSKRAVASAVKTMGTKEVVEVYPFLAYQGFSGETRARMKRRKPLLDELRTEVAEVVGKAKVEGKKIKFQRMSTATMVQITILAVALLVLAPQFGALGDSFGALANANLLWLPLIFLLVSITFLATALTVKIFSLYPMKYIDSAIVQLSSSFTNKLLPSGFGGLAVNLQFLRTRGHKVSEAAPVLAMARAVDLLCFIILATTILFFFSPDLGGIFGDAFNPETGLVIAGVAALITMVLLGIKSIRAKVKNFIKEMTATFVRLLTDLPTLGKAFASATVMNLAFLTAFFVSLQAVGLDISYAEMVLVFAVAIFAGAVAPTPGGLGVLEAAMVTTLIALGYENHLALAGVLLYRFFTYWLPTPFGFAMYRYIIKRKLI